MASKASKNKTVLGLDLSTNSIAFGIIKNGKLVNRGELDLKGELYSRIAVAGKTSKILCDANPDVVAFETAAFVNNRQVVIKLAMVTGAVLSSFDPYDTMFMEVAAITWQSYIGNSPSTKKDKAKLKKETGKSDSWVKNEIRKRRKQYTIDYVENKFNKTFESDNLADACAIASYAWEKIIEEQARSK